MTRREGDSPGAHPWLGGVVLGATLLLNGDGAPPDDTPPEPDAPRPQFRFALNRLLPRPEIGGAGIARPQLARPPARQRRKGRALGDRPLPLSPPVPGFVSLLEASAPTSPAGMAMPAPRAAAEPEASTLALPALAPLVTTPLADGPATLDEIAAPEPAGTAAIAAAASVQPAIAPPADPPALANSGPERFPRPALSAAPALDLETAPIAAIEPAALALPIDLPVVTIELAPANDNAATLLAEPVAPARAVPAANPASANDNPGVPAQHAADPAPAETGTASSAIPAPNFRLSPTPALPLEASAPEAAVPAGPPAASPPANLAASAAAFPKPAFGAGVELPVASPAAAAGKTALTDSSPRVDGGAPLISYDDELILNIVTAGGEQGDTVVAYGTRTGVYLPVGALARFLDLAIQVSDNGSFASGWFLSEDRTLSLSLREGKLVVAGKSIPLARADAAAFDGELYLRAERFADILPLAMEVDLRTQIVKITTSEPFPFEQRLAREAARSQLANRRSGDAHRWPAERTGYQALGFPLTDVELRAVSDSGEGSRLEGDLRLASEFAFLTARGYVSAASHEGLNGARLQLGRRDPDARLLGPLAASEFQFGDVSTLSLPLGLRGVQGRGAFITNIPLEEVSVFDTLDLRGELLDGYEVELYRNGILLGSTRKAVNGQYEFLQVPVEMGLNLLRLVFYGPQGQRREEVRRITVGDGRRAPGKLTYAFSAAQRDVSLFNVYDRDFRRVEDFGKWRATGLVEYGVTQGMTAALGGSWFETDGGRQWMGFAGVRTGIAGIAAKLDLGVQKGGGKAALLGIGGRLLGANYTLNHGEYRGNFVDEMRFSAGAAMRRATELNLSTALSFGDAKQPFLIPLTAQLRHVQLASGGRNIEAGVRASARLGTLQVSHTIDYSRTSRPSAPTSERLAGGFDLSRLTGSRTTVRAGVGYSLMPGPKLESAGVDVDHALDARTVLRGSAQHRFDSKETLFGLSAIRRFDNFSIALEGAYAVPTRRYSAMLRLGVGFGRNPVNGRFFLARPGLAEGGALAIRAYHDKDGDRLLGPGDELLPGVEFDIGSQRVKTDAKGVAIAGNLSDARRTSFTVLGESLPDIMLSPASEGIEFIPRAGRVHTSNFAIQMLADIEGSAYFDGRGVSGVALQLVDKTGKVVATTRTESDGFYLFEQVHPGTYDLVMESGQSGRLGIRLSEPQTVTVDAKGTMVSRDLTVVRQ